MDRRSFLGRSLAAGAAVVLAPVLARLPIEAPVDAGEIEAITTSVDLFPAAPLVYDTVLTPGAAIESFPIMGVEWEDISHWANGTYPVQRFMRAVHNGTRMTVMNGDTITIGPVTPAKPGWWEECSHCDGQGGDWVWGGDDPDETFLACDHCDGEGGWQRVLATAEGG